MQFYPYLDRATSGQDKPATLYIYISICLCIYYLGKLHSSDAGLCDCDGQGGGRGQYLQFLMFLHVTGDNGAKLCHH